MNTCLIEALRVLETEYIRLKSEEPKDEDSIAHISWSDKRYRVQNAYQYLEIVVKAQDVPVAENWPIEISEG